MRDSEKRFARACWLWEHGKAREAFRLFSDLAREGHDRARLDLALFYWQGIGTRRNRRRAIELYRELAQAHDPFGATALATIYRDSGKRRMAERWFKKGVSWGDDGALLQLAKMYAERESDRGNAIKALRQVLQPQRTLSEAEEQEAKDLLANLSERHRPAGGGP